MLAARVALFVSLILLSACSKNPEKHALKPEDSLKAIHLNGDFHAELFAEEPEVMSPVDTAFDENGKIYVAEMLDYPDDPPKGKPARSRIRLLEDTNGDGKIDRSTIFADNLLAVSGIMPWKGGLIVTSAPDILFLKDTHGNGKADVRKVLYTGFPKVNQEDRITNPTLNVDNWIYCSNMGNDGRITSPEHPEMPPVSVRGTDFRFDPITGKFEQASGPAQFGSTFDDFGNRYITQNTTHIRAVVMPIRYLVRAPLLEVTAMAQDISDHGRPSARMYPLTGPQQWRKERTKLRQQRYNENNLHITEQVGGWFTAASGGTIYSGDAFPKEYVGNVFTGDVSGNLVHRDIIFPDGPTFRAHRAHDNIEFLASTDVWFRPCKFANAPDGNLYITDIYRQVIETPESIPEEIRKKINFYNGDTLGRIYRIVPNHPARKGSLTTNLGALSSADLVKQLANPNGWNRWTAHRLLLERQDRSAIPDLKAMAANGASPEARSHALWLLQAYAVLEPAEIQQALKDSDWRIRENAVRLSEPFLNHSEPLAKLVLAAAADPDQHVQFQASLTLGNLKNAKTLATLAEIAHERSSDPWFRIAILSSVADSASPFYHMLLAKGETWSDPQLLVQLSSLIGAGRNTTELSQWFAALPKLSHQDKLLDGLARGLRLANARDVKAPGVEQVLTRLLEFGSEPVQHAAWEASRYFELDTLVHRASQDAVNPNLPQPKRILAIRALRGGHFGTVAPVLEKILQSHPTPDIEAAAVDSLSAFDEPAAGKVILENWRGYSPTAREHAVDALVAQQNRVPMLLKAIEDGQVEPSAVSGSARARLYDETDPAIVKKAHALLESSNSDRAKVVLAYRDVLNLQGNAARGKPLFEKTCGRCHLPRRQGGRVGPDLSGINNKTKEELLTSILNPSYAIEPRFVNYIITTKDGRMYDGVIANETPGSITLRGGSEDGSDETVLRRNIAEIRASTVSLMPENLEEKLSKQDIADIIAYLRGGL
ncbi:MAG TPA: PVC-type heme-binding CxxCH protein [Bryobacteraceae bacterium]|nr:PVC-type heme-binding CxxCH protein [Bryobacteraceae bacterium]